MKNIKIKNSQKTGCFWPVGIINLSRVLSVLSILAIALFAHSSECFAATTTIGNTAIIGDQVWQDSDYLVTGEVQIGTGSSLKISENSNITIAPNGKFTISGGRLDILGNSATGNVGSNSASNFATANINANNDSTYPNTTAIQMTNGVLNISNRNIISNRQFVNGYGFSSGSTTISIDNSKISGNNTNAIFANVFHNAKFSLTNSTVDSAHLQDIISTFDGVSTLIDNDTVSNFQGEAFVKSFGNSSQPRSFVTITNSKFNGTGDFTGFINNPSSFNSYANVIAMLFSNAELSVASSSFSGLGTVLNISAGAIANITSSEFDGNYDPMSIYKSVFNINNSLILNSKLLAIDSIGTTTTAMQNWWGTVDGPINTGSTTDPITGIAVDMIRPRVADGVKYTPWLLESPKKQQTICCSSIFFIPGIKGSRLYQNGFLSENQLWVPNRENDVDLLKMDSHGNSVGSPIYTRDVVDSVINFLGDKYDLKPYSDFINRMKGWQSAGDINEYFNFAYDWRLRPDQIVENGTLYSGGVNVNPVGEILRMAKTSKNGKVVIITHSNGGLLAKYIVQKLVDMGRADVLDKVITVAMPEFGAPQSVAALLHGEGESIAGGLVLSDFVARDFAKNVPTVYNLLPSEKYFTLPDTKKDIIKFQGISALIDKWRTQFGDAISSYSGLTSFLMSNKLSGVTAQISSSSIDVPAMLNQELSDYAQRAHSFLDKFTFPANLPWFSIQAIGRTTLAGLRYFDNEKCTATVIGGCTQIPGREATLSTNGDGVVIATNGQNDSNIPNLTRLDIQLDKSNEQSGLNLSHSEIMRDSTTEKTIDSIVHNKFDPTDPGQFVSTVSTGSQSVTTAPNLLDKLFRKFTVFSPVNISVTDKNGRTSGASYNPSTGHMSIKQEIPNSSYIDIGESKSVVVPANSDFQIKIQGYDTGEFSFEDKLIAQNSVAGASGVMEDKSRLYFGDIPTTNLTVANYTAQVPQNVDASNVASTTLYVSPASLKVDIDGDGAVDVNVGNSATMINSVNSSATSSVNLISTSSIPVMINMIKQKIASSSAPEYIKSRVRDSISQLENKLLPKPVLKNGKYAAATVNWRDASEFLGEMLSKFSQYLGSTNYANSDDVAGFGHGNDHDDGHDHNGGYDRDDGYKTSGATNTSDVLDPQTRSLYSTVYFYLYQINKIVSVYSNYPNNPINSSNSSNSGMSNTGRVDR
jgi:hypothetical protein